jgi:hypothetical protein
VAFRRDYYICGPEANQPVQALSHAASNKNSLQEAKGKRTRKKDGSYWWRRGKTFLSIFISRELGTDRGFNIKGKMQWIDIM